MLLIWESTVTVMSIKKTINHWSRRCLYALCTLWCPSMYSTVLHSSFATLLSLHDGICVWNKLSTVDTNMISICNATYRVMQWHRHGRQCQRHRRRPALFWHRAYNGEVCTIIRWWYNALFCMWLTHGLMTSNCSPLSCYCTGTHVVSMHDGPLLQNARIFLLAALRQKTL